MKDKKTSLKTIGRRDHVDLPELDLFNVEAKIDTGAYGSALHCHEIKLSKLKDETILMFNVLDPDHDGYSEKTHVFKDFNQKMVRSSSGESEERYVIQVKMILFDESHDVEFSLTDRSSMKYPILLGRKFLSDKFLVNVNLKDLSFRAKQETK